MENNVKNVTLKKIPPNNKNLESGINIAGIKSNTTTKTKLKQNPQKVEVFNKINLSILKSENYNLIGIEKRLNLEKQETGPSFKKIDISNKKNENRIDEKKLKTKVSSSNFNHHIRESSFVTTTLNYNNLNATNQRNVYSSLSIDVEKKKAEISNIPAITL